MSLQALQELAKITTLTPAAQERLKTARVRQREYDDRLTREVNARIPNAEALNRVVDWGVRNEP